jgi:hypothetical protein
VSLDDGRLVDVSVTTQVAHLVAKVGRSYHSKAPKVVINAKLSAVLDNSRYAFNLVEQTHQSA